MNLKFGLKPFKPDNRDLKLVNYLDTTALPPIPASFGHQNIVSYWGMLGNDSVGDCTCAGADHGIMLWTDEGAGASAPFVAANTLADYSAITGYSPSNPATDKGAMIRDVLAYMVKTGMIDSTGKRHKIGAYTLLDHTNLNEVLAAMYLFSDVEFGIQCPKSAMDQYNAGQPWTVVAGSPIEGGHDITGVGFDGLWIYVITWGKVQKMSVEFFVKYCTEAWAKLSLEFINGKGVSPEGFNLTQLQADLAAITSVPAAVTPAAKIVLNMGSTTMQVFAKDGTSKLVALDQAPVIDPVSNRTLLPIGLLAPYMDFDAIWNAATPNTVTLVNRNPV